MSLFDRRLRRRHRWTIIPGEFRSRWQFGGARTTYRPLVGLPGCGPGEIALYAAPPIAIVRTPLMPLSLHPSGVRHESMRWPAGRFAGRCRGRVRPRQRLVPVARCAPGHRPGHPRAGRHADHARADLTSLKAAPATEAVAKAGERRRPAPAGGQRRPAGAAHLPGHRQSRPGGLPPRHHRDLHQRRAGQQVCDRGPASRRPEQRAGQDGLDARGAAGAEVAPAAEREPPADLPIGQDGGGTFGPADGTRPGGAGQVRAGPPAAAPPAARPSAPPDPQRWRGPI